MMGNVRGKDIVHSLALFIILFHNTYARAFIDILILFHSRYA